MFYVYIYNVTYYILYNVLYYTSILYISSNLICIFLYLFFLAKYALDLFWSCFYMTLGMLQVNTMPTVWITYH